MTRDALLFITSKLLRFDLIFRLLAISNNDIGRQGANQKSECSTSGFWVVRSGAVAPGSSKGGRYVARRIWGRHIGRPGCLLKARGMARVVAADPRQRYSILFIYLVYSEHKLVPDIADKLQASWETKDVNSELPSTTKWEQLLSEIRRSESKKKASSYAFTSY